MVNLLLARHGNTFEPGDPVVWVGARNDMALSTKGLVQAKSVGELLVRSELIPVARYCSELVRTTEYATIIGQELGLEGGGIQDSRLCEVDYGSWSGKSSSEVESMGFSDELEYVSIDKTT